MQQLDIATRQEIIQHLSEKLRKYYIFPDVAEQICQRLQNHLEDGEYTDITEGEFFAYALTTHLHEVNHDEHLWVRWYSDPLPDDEGSLLQNEERLVELRQEALLDNYGFHKVERLPGNVGYVAIRYFHRPLGGSGDTAVSAMNFLTHTNALIIDLRQCQGGSPGMVALLSSYLFAGEPIHLNSLYWREEDFTQQYWTLHEARSALLITFLSGGGAAWCFLVGEPNNREFNLALNKAIFTDKIAGQEVEMFLFTRSGF